MVGNNTKKQCEPTQLSKLVRTWIRVIKICCNLQKLSIKKRRSNGKNEGLFNVYFKADRVDYGKNGYESINLKNNPNLMSDSIYLYNLLPVVLVNFFIEENV